jgi:hypothetical protein
VWRLGAVAMELATERLVRERAVWRHVVSLADPPALLAMPESAEVGAPQSLSPALGGVVSE